MRFLVAVTATALLASPKLVSAQAASARTASPQVTLLQNWLRNLVVTQEKYWSEHGSYTTDLSALQLFTPHGRTPTSALPDSVLLQVIQAGGRSWWGRA